MTDAHMVETLRLRTAALHRVQRSNDLLRQECRDRDATEADVRARLADAESALADLRALADEWEGDYRGDAGKDWWPPTVIAELRAALDGKP